MTAALTRRHPFPDLPDLPDLPVDMDVLVLAKPFALNRLLPLVAQRMAHIAMPVR
jgi:hypothetical protein